MNDDGFSGIEPIQIETRAQFRDEVATALATAQGEILLADHDFAGWPLNSPAVEEALRRFFLASRVNRMRLLTTPAHQLHRESPRLMSLLRDFGHVFSCRYPPDTMIARFSQDTCLLVIDRVRVVRRFNRHQPRGSAEFSPDEGQAWADHFESIWNESTASLSVTTLGL